MKILLSLLFSINALAAGVTLDGITASGTNENFVAHLKLSSSISSDQTKVEYINETIQVDIPGVKVPSGKMYKKIESDGVKSFFAYQLNDDTARFRIILEKGSKAEAYKDKVVFQAVDKGFDVTLNFQKLPNKVEVAATEKETTLLSENEIEKELKELTSIAESKGKTEKKDTKSEGTTEDKKEKPGKRAVAAAEPAGIKKEADIPVLVSTTDKKEKSKGTSFARVILSLVILLAALVVAWWSIQKWMKKKNLKNPHTSIRVVTQHYLGPKKSLAIISVAGESILIGITDHNISLIKSLALLDGEVPGDLPENFNETLKEANADGEGVEDYAVKGIRDIVSDRLKGMRSL